MDAQMPSSLEQSQLRKPLQNAITALFIECAPNWKTPCLEFRAVPDFAGRKIKMTARAFDLQGDGEIERASEPLILRAIQYHSLCSSLGQGWSKCLLTLILDDKGKIKSLNWNYSY